MLRRFLTALALITGLAASGAPAHAAVAEALGAEMIAGDSCIAARPGQSRECVLERGVDPITRDARRACPQVRQPVIVYIPTVQFGADRAFE